MNGRSVRPHLRVACPATDSCRREPSVGGEKAFQPVVTHRDGGPADPRLGDFSVEGVDSPRPHVQLGRSVTLPDPAGVGEDLVAQALGGAVEERARQAGQVGGTSAPSWAPPSSELQRNPRPSDVIASLRGEEALRGLRACLPRCSCGRASRARQRASDASVS